MLLSFILLIATSLMYLYLIGTLEQHTSSRLLAGAFLWGMVSFGIALVIQNRMLGTILNLNGIQLFSAPVLEELLKALPLLWFISRKNRQPTVVYGFVIGLGFALVESVSYMIAKPESALLTALARVISIHLIHSVNTALVGLAVSRWASVHPVVIILMSTMLLHSAFNWIVLSLRGDLQMIVAANIGVGAMIFLMLLIGGGNRLALLRASQPLSR